MEIFSTYEKIFAFAIVRPPLKKKKKNIFQKIVTNPKLLFINGTTAVGWVFLLIYVFTDAREFREYSESIYALTTLATTMFGMEIFDWKKEEQFKLIDSFKKIVKERSKNPLSKVIYDTETAFVEKWHAVIKSAFLKVTIPCITLPYLIWSYFVYFTTDLGKDAFHMPFMAWTIIEWRDPFTYPFYFLYEVEIVYYAIMFCVVFVCYPFGACHMITAFADDIKAHIKQLNDLYAEKEAEFYQKLHQTIAFHSTAKQLANDFNDTCQFILTNFFLWALSTICNMLLLFQIEFTSGSPNISALLKLSCLSFWAYLSIFMLCNSGDSVVCRFQEIDVYNLCDWRLYPQKARRMLPIIIMNSQPQVSIQAYGNIQCSRETFKGLSNQGLSFFMIFRQFLK